ncbi:MAG: ribokinase [Gemmatimonadota bacterium]
MSTVRILNLGSLNIDHVYQVDHIARPGETLSSASYRLFAGGKGANQSAALGRAGADVHHAGRVGPDGRWLLDRLAAVGVDVAHVRLDEGPTGHAVIQVDPAGENAIFLFPGSNRALTHDQVDTCLQDFTSGDILLLQNEINLIPHILRQASDRGLRIFLNPAPYGPEAREYPLDRVDVLVMNQSEAAGLGGLEHGADPAELLDAVALRAPAAALVLTLGARGALYRSGTEEIAVQAMPVRAVDTTGAGDTFIGYLIADLARDRAPAEALRRAAAAAAVCCTRRGAMDSIPGADEVDDALARWK